MSSLKQILYTSYYGDLDGGGELRMLDHMENSKIPRNLFTVLLLKEGDLRSKLENLNIRSTVIPWSWRLGPLRKIIYFPNTFIKILMYIQKLRPNVVLCNTYLDLIIAGPAAAILNIPIIWRSRAEIFPRLARTKTIKKIIILWFIKNKIYKIIPTTIYDRDLMIHYGIPDSKVRTIYNGVDLASYNKAKSSRERLRCEFNISDNEILIGFVARLTPLKGHDYFFHAVKKIRERIFNVKALVVGSTSEEHKYELHLKKTVKELGLDDTIIFTGQRNDIADIMSAIDIFVSASLQETFGTTIIEAMAAGKPVIATKTAGSMEIIKSGDTGILTPIKDSDELCHAIEYLCLNPEKAQKIGTAGKIEVNEIYNLHRNIEKIDNHILNMNLR